MGEGEEESGESRSDEQIMGEILELQENLKIDLGYIDKGLWTPITNEGSWDNVQRWPRKIKKMRHLISEMSGSEKKEEFTQQFEALKKETKDKSAEIKEMRNFIPNFLKEQSQSLEPEQSELLEKYVKGRIWSLKNYPPTPTSSSGFQQEIEELKKIKEQNNPVWWDTGWDDFLNEQLEGYKNFNAPWALEKAQKKLEQAKQDSPVANLERLKKELAMAMSEGKSMVGGPTERVTKRQKFLQEEIAQAEQKIQDQRATQESPAKVEEFEKLLEKFKSNQQKIDDLVKKRAAWLREYRKDFTLSETVTKSRLEAVITEGVVLATQLKEFTGTEKWNELSKEKLELINSAENREALGKVGGELREESSFQPSPPTTPSEQESPIPEPTPGWSTAKESSDRYSRYAGSNHCSNYLAAIYIKMLPHGANSG